MTSAREDSLPFATAARRWLRTTRTVAVRSTAASFVIGLVVASLLVIVHGLDNPSGELVLGVPGLRIHTGLDERAYALPLLLVALAGWVLLTSLSRLVVARQVRGYLRDLPEHRAGGGEEPDHDADVMSERLMLEAYLSIATSAARAVAMTCALAVILPWQAMCGVVVCWLVAVLIGRRRFDDGRTISQGLTAATRQARADPGASAHDRLVDAIYERDTRMHRLTVAQAAALLGSVLVLVVVPAWLARSGGGATTAVLVVLLWLQALQAGVTESGGLGWRAQMWFEQQGRGPVPERGPRGERALRAGLMWWPVPSARVMVVAVLGRSPDGGADLAADLRPAVADIGAGLVLVTPRSAREMSADLARELGLGLSVLLVDLAPRPGRGIGDRVRECGGVVLRTVTTSGDGGASDPTRVVITVEDVRRLAAGGNLVSAIELWADPVIDQDQAQERTDALVRAADEVMAAREDLEDSLGFES